MDKFAKKEREVKVVAGQEFEVKKRALRKMILLESDCVYELYA